MPCLCANGPEPFVTVLVPMLNEAGHIETCLSSLRDQDYKAEKLEFIVLDGGSADRGPEIVARIGEADSRVRLMQNPGRIQAAALNLGIARAVGEIIVRADAHALYGATYVSTCVAHLISGRAENVGGLQRATGASRFAKAVAAAQNSRLGAGNAAYRVSKEAGYVDTVWLGAWYRQTLLDLGGFDESASPNEDYELNYRLRKLGGRILLDPSLASTYFARASLASLWRQYFRYGQGRVRTFKKHPGSLVLRQAIPPAFVSLLCVCCLLIPWTSYPALGLGALYGFLVLSGAFLRAKNSSWMNFAYLLVIYPAIHFSWGLGFIFRFLWWGGVPSGVRNSSMSGRVEREGNL